MQIESWMMYRDDIHFYFTLYSYVIEYLSKFYYTINMHINFNPMSLFPLKNPPFLISVCEILQPFLRILIMALTNNIKQCFFCFKGSLETVQRITSLVIIIFRVPTRHIRKVFCVWYLLFGFVIWSCWLIPTLEHKLCLVSHEIVLRLNFRYQI